MLYKIRYQEKCYGHKHYIGELRPKDIADKRGLVSGNYLLKNKTGYYKHAGNDYSKKNPFRVIPNQ